VDTTRARSEGEIRNAVREVREMGLRGLKVHQRLQNLRLSGWEIDVILRAAGEQGFPVVFCGFPLSLTAENCLEEMTPYRYDALAKRHPQVRIVIAHLGGHRALDAFFVAKSNRNVFLDTSLVFHYLRNTSVYADFLHILKYLPRQTLFGSDYPEVSPADYANDVRRELSVLPAATAQAICADNLLSLLPPER
jgi:predicted TIM-barrel fold metal-dependent hydrolase